MQKAKTASRKAESTRNRHNGRVNAAKQHILDKGETFIDSKGVMYSAVPKRRWIQDTMAFMSDGELDITKGWWMVTSSIVKVPA